MAPNPFTAPPLQATEPMEGVTGEDRNFRALLSQGYGAAPVAQAYASVGGTGVPPSLAFGGPQVHTPGPLLRQGNPSPQGAGRLNPVFRSPAAVTPVGTAFQSPGYAPLPRMPPPIKEDRYLASLPDRITSSRSSDMDARDMDPAARRDGFERHLDLLPPAKRQRQGLSIREEGSPLVTGGAGLRCARCYTIGHQPVDCPLNMHCEYCRGNNHITADCPSMQMRHK
jgi:hypothetical protein